MKIVNTVLFAACLVIGSPIFAARPFNTDDPGIVEPAIVEFESGINVNKGGKEGYVLFGTGVSKRADFGVGFNVIPDVGELECGMKLSLFNTSSFHSAFSLGWLPGNKNFNVNLIGNFSLPIFEILVNISVPSNVNNVSGGILIGKPMLDEKVYLGGELNPEYSRKDGKFSFSTQIGAGYNIVGNLSIDAGIGTQNNALQFTTGLIYDF